MAREPMTRYDFASLQQATGMDVPQMALRLGSNSTQTLYTLRRDGLSFNQAETWSVKLGLLPELVWPEWREESNRLAAEQEERDRLEAEAKAAARRARRNANQRRRYRENPETRSRRLEAARRYYSECGDYVRQRVAQNYWANREARLAQDARYRAANRDRINAAQNARRAAERAS